MLRLSVDDACASDILIAQMAEKYNIPTTFYWPVEWHSLAYENGYKPLNYTDAINIAAKHEIGAHTITHRHLTTIGYDEAFKEIVESKTALERLFCRKITKFCPPRGWTNEQLTELVMEYYDEQRLTRGEGLVHIHPKSGANNNMHWLEYAKTIDVKELWCHSWELNKYGEWDNLNKYLKEHA